VLGAAATVTLTIVDVAVMPFESVALAVSEAVPTAVGVHEVEYGAANAVPMLVEPTRKSTRVIVAVPVADAVAVKVCAVPAVTVAPFDGPVRATEMTGAVKTVTAAEVTVDVLPEAVSVASAVSW
jgi:hypothetical protein